MGSWMIMQRNDLRYYFRTESVILEIPNKGQIGNSYISFNCYTLQSRKKFKKFSRVLQESRNSEYSNINDIFGLARRYGIRPTSASRPTIIDTIAF